MASLLDRKRSRQMAGRLDGKVAVITGAASGIGLASARLFVAEGARVVMGDINAERLASAVTSVDASGERAVGQAVDVSVSDQVADLIAAAVGRFGRLDVM